MTRQTMLVLSLLLPAPAVAQDRSSSTSVELHGTVLLNGFWNGARVNNSDVPTIVLVPAAGTTRTSALGGSVRQTRLTATLRNEDVLGARLFGELDVDFFGGQQPSGGGRTHPVPRIRRAYGELRWTNVTVLVGQEAPPIAELNPASVASLGFPLFASSGNLWLWLPQVRVTGWIWSDRGVRIGFEGAVLAPSSGDPQDPFLTQPDRAERSGTPAFEGRLVARWTAGGRPGTVSIGGHYGRFVRPDDSLTSSRAVVVGVSTPLGRWAEVRAEAFRGQGLAGLGGGGIGQLTSESGFSPLHTEGGWAQVLVFPTPGFELGAGFGIDDPRDSQLSAATSRVRNRTFALSAVVRHAPLLVGLELRRGTTDYLGPPVQGYSNTHINVSVGFEF